jgi:hypothetical protein
MNRNKSLTTTLITIEVVLLILINNFMSNTQHSSITTNVLLVLALIAGFALTLLLAVPQAQAATYPNLTVSRDMTTGATGPDVVVLQGLLSELGYLNVPAGVPFGYYGSLTQNAVARYQTARNVTPSAGYFGSLTKTALRQHLSQQGWLTLLGW